MKRVIFRISVVIIGGILGFMYYNFIGCTTGTCPITRNPYLSILFGMIIGLILIFPTKKTKNE